MRQEIFGKGLTIDRIVESATGKGIMTADRKYYTLIGIDPSDFEEAGIRAGVKIKGTIVGNDVGTSTFYHIEGWSLAGGETAETEEVKTEIRRKKATK
jgi:hypothetical protein